MVVILIFREVFFAIVSKEVSRRDASNIAREAWVFKTIGEKLIFFSLKITELVL